MAKNAVIEGDYKGKQIVCTLGVSVIVLGFTKSIELTKANVESYEVLDEEKRKSALSGVARAAIGGFLLGGVGLLAGGLSAKSKGEYLISIQFTDGKKSLLHVNDKIYKSIISKCF